MLFHILLKAHQIPNFTALFTFPHVLRLDLYVSMSCKVLINVNNLILVNRFDILVF